MKANRSPGYVAQPQRDEATPRRAEPRIISARSSLLPSTNEAGLPAQRSIATRGGTDLLTARDLEELLKIDVKTIYGYVQRGLIPYVRIQSNVRFVRQQILDWIEERNFRPRQNFNHH